MNCSPDILPQVVVHPDRPTLELAPDTPSTKSIRAAPVKDIVCSFTIRGHLLSGSDAAQVAASSSACGSGLAAATVAEFDATAPRPSAGDAGERRYSLGVAYAQKAYIVCYCAGYDSTAGPNTIGGPWGCLGDVWGAHVVRLDVCLPRVRWMPAHLDAPGGGGTPQDCRSNRVVDTAAKAAAMAARLP